MIYTTLSTIAGNGSFVSGTVELLDTDNAPHRWRANAGVNHATLATSHHASRVAAERWAERMHKAYLKVHSAA